MCSRLQTYAKHQGSVKDWGHVIILHRKKEREKEKPLGRTMFPRLWKERCPPDVLAAALWNLYFVMNI